jgi:hypothetical protein
VRTGATVTLINTSFTNGQAAGGAGFQSGQGKAGAIFVHTGATVNSQVALPTFSGNTATDAGATATDNNDVFGTINITPIPQEIEVLEGATSIPDNTGVVSFGSTPLGTPITKTFVVRNAGGADLTLTTPISMPNGFSVAASFGSTTLGAGITTTFQIRLDATATGAFSGTVQFSNNDADENPFNFIVSGTVTGPEIQVRLAGSNIVDGVGVVAFGTTSVGTPVTRTFTISNTGNANLILTPPISVPSGFSVPASFGATTVAPNSTTTFQVRLDATATGVFSGTVQFGNNDADENPFNFTVTGTVESVERLVYLPLVRKE